MCKCMNTIFLCNIKCGLYMRREAGMLLTLCCHIKCLQISVKQRAKRKFLFLLLTIKNFTFFSLSISPVIWLKVMAVKLVPSVLRQSLARFIERIYIEH